MGRSAPVAASRSAACACRPVRMPSSRYRLVAFHISFSRFTSIRSMSRRITVPSMRRTLHVHCHAWMAPAWMGQPARWHASRVVLLGVIWRENPSCYLQDGEQAVLMAALMETDNDGRPLIDAWIKRSGLTADAWLEKLFEATVIPFYHLLCRYGVALIAHGQNVTLVMKDSIPQRILLKDFQGDMRLVDEDFPQARSLPELVKAKSAEQYIHAYVNEETS